MCFRLNIKKCFCKKLIRISHTICFKYSLSRVFLKSDIHFYFNIVVSNNVIYFPLGFIKCSVLMLSQKDLEHIFQSYKSEIYVQNKSPSIMAYIFCFCNPLTVIKFVLLLEYRLGNEGLVGYCTIVRKVLATFSNWGAICSLFIPRNARSTHCFDERAHKARDNGRQKHKWNSQSWCF